MYTIYLVAEFISPRKVYTFSFIVGNIIPKSEKCIHSATKFRSMYKLLGQTGRHRACGVRSAGRDRILGGSGDLLSSYVIELKVP